ncbi:hypothetical protein BGZ76_006494, partial [Entomortierella beljakovae]
MKIATVLTVLAAVVLVQSAPVLVQRSASESALDQALNAQHRAQELSGKNNIAHQKRNHELYKRSDLHSYLKRGDKGKKSSNENTQ